MCWRSGILLEPVAMCKNLCMRPACCRGGPRSASILHAWCSHQTAACWWTGSKAQVGTAECEGEEMSESWGHWVDAAGLGRMPGGGAAACRVGRLGRLGRAALGSVGQETVFPGGPASVCRFRLCVLPLPRPPFPLLCTRPSLCPFTMRQRLSPLLLTNPPCCPPTSPRVAHRAPSACHNKNRAPPLTSLPRFYRGHCPGAQHLPAISSGHAPPVVGHAASCRHTCSCALPQPPLQWQPSCAPGSTALRRPPPLPAPRRPCTPRAPS